MNEVGKIGVEEEGADEDVPRGARGEQDDTCSRDSVWNVPRSYSHLQRPHTSTSSVTSPKHSLVRADERSGKMRREAKG